MVKIWNTNLVFNEFHFTDLTDISNMHSGFKSFADLMCMIQQVNVGFKHSTYIGGKGGLGADQHHSLSKNPKIRVHVL